jgi:hypothetical protein
MRKLIIGSLITAAIVLVACSAPDPQRPTDKQESEATGGGSKSPGSSSGGSSGAPSSSSGGSSGSTSGGTGSSSGADPGGACNASQGVKACESCCDAKSPKGLAAMDKIDDAYSECLCQASVCETECAQSECSDADNSPDATEGDACSKCMEGTAGKACEDQWDKACAADADCAALQKCYDDSKCDPDE